MEEKNKKTESYTYDGVGRVGKLERFSYVGKRCNYMWCHTIQYRETGVQYRIA